MRAAYVKAPFQITVKEVSLRPLKETEVLIDIKVCGVCGHDLILMRSGAVSYTHLDVYKRQGRDRGTSDNRTDEDH